MKARRVSRARVVQALYQLRMTGEWDGVDVLRQSFPLVDEAWAGEGRVEEEDLFFTSQLAQVVLERGEEIDALVLDASLNWRPDRMAAVDLSVLRLATAELLVSTAPTRVVFNEAVELARLFGTESSASFVNGVLDGVLRLIEAQASSP